jgi:hypothetical protein
MPISSDSLDGKTALATGTGPGLGRAIAAGLARPRPGSRWWPAHLTNWTRPQAQYGTWAPARWWSPLTSAAPASSPVPLGAELHHRFTSSYQQGT